MGGGVGYQEPTVDLKHEHKKFRDIRRPFIDSRLRLDKIIKKYLGCLRGMTLLKKKFNHMT